MGTLARCTTDVGKRMGWFLSGPTTASSGSRTQHRRLPTGPARHHFLINHDCAPPALNDACLQTYHVCLRWFTEPHSLSLELEMEVTLAGVRVYSETAMWDTGLTRNTACTPDANGYIGSYTYTPDTAGGTGGGSSAAPVLEFRASWSFGQGERAGGGREREKGRGEKAGMVRIARIWLERSGCMRTS